MRRAGGAQNLENSYMESPEEGPRRGWCIPRQKGLGRKLAGYRRMQDSKQYSVVPYGTCWGQWWPTWKSKETLFYFYITVNLRQIKDLNAKHESTALSVEDVIFTSNTKS